MESYKVGRSRDCHVILSDESISREHAVIVPHGNNAFELSDEASTHGTFVEEAGVWVRVQQSVVVSGDAAVMLGRFQTTIGQLLVEYVDARDATDSDLTPGADPGRRRLAAIVALDVVGYSAKMGEDETRTLAVLNQVRAEVVDPCLAQFGGRLFKEIGDGLLVEFASVNDAVMFAVEVQRMMLARNLRTMEHRRMDFRIGINVGDVIVQGDDLMGEGVNIAARLEPLADSGGITLSGVVRELVKSKLDLGYKNLGDKRLKNIADPVRVYALPGPGSDSKTKPKKRKKGILPI